MGVATTKKMGVGLATMNGRLCAMPLSAVPNAGSPRARERMRRPDDCRIREPDALPALAADARELEAVPGEDEAEACRDRVYCAVLDAARREPDVLLEGGDPVTLDGVQREPDLLRAVKCAVDRRRVPGRFLLLERIAETRAGDTWRNVREALETIQVVENERDGARIQQTTELRPSARALLGTLKVEPPAPIHASGRNARISQAAQVHDLRGRFAPKCRDFLWNVRPRRGSPGQSRASPHFAAMHALRAAVRSG